MKDPPLLIKSRDGLGTSYFPSAGVNGLERNIWVNGPQQCLYETGEALAYEHGRLFAHCTALGRLVPCLPRRGDRERDCRDAPHEYHRAQFVERSSFPKPFLNWKRAVTIACGLGRRETLRSKAAV